jgi:hypothetical protein
MEANMSKRDQFLYQESRFSAHEKTCRVMVNRRRITCDLADPVFTLSKVRTVNTETTMLDRQGRVLSVRYRASLYKARMIEMCIEVKLPTMDDIQVREVFAQIVGNPAVKYVRCQVKDGSWVLEIFLTPFTRDLQEAFQYADKLINLLANGPTVECLGISSLNWN